MHLTTTNYRTLLHADLIAHARKNNVREFDETSKGNFVAYVDEGEDKTFDVSLTLSSLGELSISGCDCKSKVPFCRHKIALLMKITEEQKKIKKSAKTSGKNAVSFSLIDDVQMGELKDWLKKVFVNNAPFEMAFIHHFGERNKSYTPKEVEQLTLDAVKVVVKNKKLIDLTQLKKIIELWTDIHAPIVNQYRNNVLDESLFANVHTLIESCVKIFHILNINSKKIIAYIEGLLKDCLPELLSLPDDAKLRMANGYFINQLISTSGVIQYPYLQHLLNAIDQSSSTRRLILIDQLLNKYQETKTEIRSEATFTKTIFDMVLKYELGNKYYKNFLPIMWQNNYNIKLIKLLVLNKEYKLAEKYTKAQIASNAREEYNVPYYEQLREMYTTTNNKVGLASILAQLLPLTFSFDDYLFVSKHIKDEDERKKWRSKLLSRASNASRSNTNAQLFCFQLADQEKQYKKMIGYIKEQTPYSLILEFLSPMLLTAKDELLRALISKSEGWNWESDIDSELDAEENIPFIYKELEKAFSHEHLKHVVLYWRKGWSYSSNKFVAYIESFG